jgi:tetratricopeptide (TPR) repeat protein
VNHHPTPAELEELVHGGMLAERRRAVIAHLIHGCEECNARLMPQLYGLFSLESIPEMASPPPLEENYDEALDRAFAFVRQLSTNLPPLKTPEDRKQEVLALLASGGLEALQDLPPHLQGLPAYNALLERSWSLRHESPDEMVQLAHCAVLLAERLDEKEHGLKKVVDLRCRAWVELGNAYRVADQLDQADEALNRATELFLLGTRNDLLGARFFDILASQYTARRSFDPACNALDIVASIYRRHGDEHLAGRALIMKGIFMGYRGDAENAVRSIESGLASINERLDPRLAFSAIQSHAWFLVDCGRLREAQSALRDLGRRKLDPGGRVNELKVRWLEGHIHEGLEELEDAERALIEVKHGFEETGLTYKAALAGLELGAVWLRQSRADDAARVVLESTDVFLSLQIQREFLASVLMLRKAVEMKYLNLTLLRQVIDFLYKPERDPRARPYPEMEP